METKSSQAAVLFDSGINCAQSVFSVFAKDAGLNEEQALKIAATFGGGMGRMGEVCGAVTGALMAMGISAGNTNPLDSAAKGQDIARVQTFATQFKQRHGTLLCRELLGYTLSNPQELQRAKEEGLFKTRCPLFVMDAATIAESILNRTVHKE